jgi:hypothetical protein
VPPRDNRDRAKIANSNNQERNNRAE